MKNRRNSLLSRLAVVATIVIVAMSTIAATRSNKGEIARNLDIFNALYKELQTNYVDSIDAESRSTSPLRPCLTTSTPIPSTTEQATKRI